MTNKRSITNIAMATIVLVSLCAVCASTSVSAAEGGSANAQPSAALVGAPVGMVGAPAVCSHYANGLDLFVNGTDGALWYKHWNNTAGWSAWTSLGGHLTSSPAVTAIPLYSAVYVFGRGANGALYCKTTGDGGATWQPWFKIGGQLLAGTGPAAYSLGASGNTPAEPGWFVTGTNHALYHSWIENAVIQGWKSLGGYLTSSPAATSPGNGTIDVAARGSNGALYEKTTTNNGTSWSSWSSLGGQLASGTAPAGSNWGSSRTDWFVAGTNHALYHSWTGHSGWENLGGVLTSSPAATARSSGSIDVFARGSDNGLWQRTYSTSTWGSWGSIGGI